MLTHGYLLTSPSPTVIDSSAFSFCCISAFFNTNVLSVATVLHEAYRNDFSIACTRKDLKTIWLKILWVCKKTRHWSSWFGFHRQHLSESSLYHSAAPPFSSDGGQERPSVKLLPRGNRDRQQLLKTDKEKSQQVASFKGCLFLVLISRSQASVCAWEQGPRIPDHPGTGSFSGTTGLMCSSSQEVTSSSCIHCYITFYVSDFPLNC